MVPPLRVLFCGLLLLALTAAGGCFDGELEIELDAKGGGKLNLGMWLPAGGAPPPPLKVIVFPLPIDYKFKKGSRQFWGQRLEFLEFQELRLAGLEISIKRTKEKYLGFGTAHHRVTLRVDPALGQLGPASPLHPMPSGGPGPGLPPGPDAERARRLRAKALAGHFLLVRLKVPGRVLKAEALYLRRLAVKPSLGGSGREARWRVPLASLVNLRIREPLVFRLVFQGGWPLYEAKTQPPPPAKKKVEKKGKKKAPGPGGAKGAGGS